LADVAEVSKMTWRAASRDSMQLHWKLTWLDFGRSKAKVTAGRQGGEGIHVDAVASKPIF